MEKYFIITVDTEGDNLWESYQTESGYRKITTENAKYLPRFQRLCEKYGFIPTYLTNYEMALDNDFSAMAREGVAHKTLEIGMHLHAWNSPPLYELPFNPKGHNAYAGEYPREVLKEKIYVLTHLLQERFQCDIKSHRGGRWYLDSDICKFLLELGYTVDCTVTPGHNWNTAIGNQRGGIDYREFPDDIYWMDIETLKEGNSALLEVPPTIIEPAPFRLRLPQDVKDFKSMIDKKRIWMRPNGHNLYNLLYIVEECSKNSKYIEFMIHSSELMPGGSPTFKNEASIERLYKHLAIVFERLRTQGYQGCMLSKMARIYEQ